MTLWLLGYGGGVTLLLVVTTIISINHVFANTPKESPREHDQEGK